MKLKFALAGLLAAASFSAMAADQTVTVSLDHATTFASSTVAGDVLTGGLDVLTFDGLGAGQYKISITLTGLDVAWDAANTKLNGVTGGWDFSMGEFKYFGISSLSATSPFVLDLAGSVSGMKPGYTGVVNVSPVPEPTTYGMLLGGLGIMAFLARRKKQA